MAEIHEKKETRDLGVRETAKRESGGNAELRPGASVSDFSDRTAELKAKISRELNKGGARSGEVSFQGSHYESLMRDVERHQKNKLEYERRANKLESDIRAGKIDKSQMSEVYKLRRMAEAEGRELEKAKNMAQNELLNFRGGSNMDRPAETDGGMNVNISFGSETSGPCADLCRKTGVKVGYRY